MLNKVASRTRLRLVITDYDRFTFQLPISRDALKQLKALITLSTEKK